jgi:hypothetical protein
VLRAIPFTASFRYNFVIGQNVAAISAVIGTGVLTRNVHKFSSQSRIKTIPETTQKSLADLGIAAVQASTSSPHDVEDKASCAHIHKTHRQFLEDACFGVHVDTTWHTLPEDVRRFLLLRVSGEPAVVTHTVHVWLSERKDCSPQHGQHLHHITGSRDATDIPGASSSRCENIIESELTSDCARDVASRRLSLAQMLAQGIDDVVQWISVISGAAHDCRENSGTG